MSATISSSKSLFLITVPSQHEVSSSIISAALPKYQTFHSHQLACGKIVFCIRFWRSLQLFGTIQTRQGREILGISSWRSLYSMMVAGTDARLPGPQNILCVARHQWCRRGPLTVHIPFATRPGSVVPTGSGHPSRTADCRQKFR